MKKQFTLTTILICLSMFAFAQGAEVCQGTPYAIANTVAATTGSQYRWTENGKVISGAAAAVYTVPSSKVAGVYTYVRQSKSSDCPDWQSSNEFTVTVFACTVTVADAPGSMGTFTDSRDGKVYKIVRMPDDKVWFAQNLNYTQDMTFNQYASQANGKVFTTATSGVPAIGSYWCPSLNGSTYSGDQNACNIYGALYTWETAMMVDGKYADESKTSSVWDENWVIPNYLPHGAPSTSPNSKINNARGEHGICPKGWTIPTDYDWANLLDKVEGNTTYTVDQTATGWWGTTAGVQLKSSATYTGEDPGNGAWSDSPNRGTNSTGFEALSCGYKAVDGLKFVYRGTHAMTLSSSVITSTSCWANYLHAAYGGSNRTTPARYGGYSVRCMRSN